MKFTDQLIECSECQRKFLFRVEEQRRMASDGGVVEPELCPACREQDAENGRIVGHVKWFDPSKGYGFISRDDGRGEVFVHRSEIQYQGPKVLYEGERVEFELEQDRRGEKAVNVTGHDPFAP
ncbi:MAG TPA: cold-shock protein [Chloroflexi bacterium]|nr:cold-shock protein [Chloroflexota bacterium]